MQTETQILNGYWSLLQNLNTKMKHKLLKKLSDSLNQESENNLGRFEKSFGAWDDARPADEIISELTKSRVFNREIEQF